MGGWTSKLFGPNETLATHQKTVWQKEGYYEDYSKSHLLSNDTDTAEQEELLAMLDSAGGQYFLGRFSAEIGTQQGFHAWSDIQEFKAIPTDDYRYFKAKQFANKYLGNGPKELKLEFVAADVREDISKCIAQASEDRHILGGQLFSSVEKMIFQEIYNVTFKALKKDDADRYNTYVADRAQVNRIDVDDFDYREKIAEGTFGRVVHVVKKTTGQHYAMKIQFKLDLCRTYKHDLSGVLNEKNVLVKCHHALLVHLDYALQTELHVILVLNLATSGTIQDAIDAAPEKRLDEERTRFYAAEITLALMYLHDNKLMYRDLKPRNVMLGMDGHIQLGDMGGAAQSADKSGHKIRRRSVMGTKGYMAPEVAGLMDQSHRHGEGYTDVADWYSLGVTTYKMLTGLRLDNQPRAETTTTRRNSFVAMLQPPAPVVPTSDAELEYPPSVSDSAKAFVSALLLPESERLGSGETGNKDIQSHPFMEGIEWEELEAKRVKPPYMPAKKSIGDQAHFASFDEMMEILQETDGRSKKSRSASPSMTIDEQKCFGNFHYVSPQTLKREMGLSRGADDIEPTFKMVQLTGESSLTSEVAKTNITFRRTGKAVKHIGRALTQMGSNVSNSSPVAGSGARTAPGSPHSPSPFPRSPASQPNGSSVYSTDGSFAPNQAGRPNVRPRIALVTPPPL